MKKEERRRSQHSVVALDRIICCESKHEADNRNAAICSSSTTRSPFSQVSPRNQASARSRTARGVLLSAYKTSHLTSITMTVLAGRQVQSPPIGWCPSKLSLGRVAEVARGSEPFKEVGPRKWAV